MRRLSGETENVGLLAHVGVAYLPSGVQYNIIRGDKEFEGDVVHLGE